MPANFTFFNGLIRFAQFQGSLISTRRFAQDKNDRETQILWNENDE
jgi:hypothetical protein